MYFQILFILLFYNIHLSNSIRCWDCNSDSDPKCADPFDNSTVYMKDCDKEPHLENYPDVKATMCRKIRQKGYNSYIKCKTFLSNINGVWRYYRSCAFLGEPGIGKDERYCIVKKGTYNIWSEYCTCVSKDGCNTANKNLQISTATLISILFLRFFL